MAVKVLPWKWARPRPWLAAALLVIGLAAAALWLRVALSPRLLTPGASVEIVYSQPLHATHAMPSSQPVTLANGSTGDEEVGSPSGSLTATGSSSAAALLPADFYDFGSITSQAVVRHDFLVINRGSAPLLIRQAYTTCGCTTADLSTTRIPPGKAARATVIFDAGFHPVAGQTVRRGLILETNDPDHPQLEIWVQAAVK